MPNPSKPISVSVRAGALMLLGAVTVFFIAGCARQANETEQKATQKFYQHSDSKPDPFLPKKDD